MAMANSSTGGCPMQDKADAESNGNAVELAILPAGGREKVRET